MSRSVIPPGRVGLVILAAVIGPAVLKKCRPITRRIGEGMVKLGEKMREYAGEGTSATEEAPKADVKSQPTATTKVGAKTKETAVNTAAPTGQEEVGSHVAAEAKGSANVSSAPAKKKSPAKTKTKPDQPLNPKRTAVAPPKTTATKPKPKRTSGANG